MVTVVGVDGANRDGVAGWIAVRLVGGRLRAYGFHDSFRDVLDAAGDAGTVAVDIPIGHDDPDGTLQGGRRLCDRAAKDALGPRHASVFMVPPFEALRAANHGAARNLCEANGWIKPSMQMWNIRARILEVDAVARTDERVVEAHPEVSFQAMNGSTPLEHAKTSHDGRLERLGLLHEVGLRPRRVLGGLGMANPVDVLDASAAAWTAMRVANGDARTLPDEPPVEPGTGRRVAIHV